MQKREVGQGFTLLEAIVALGIFSLLTVGVLSALGVLQRSVKAHRESVIVSALASERLEIARNLPYSLVGTAAGNPSGSLPDGNNPFSTTIEGQQYQVYYEVTYIDDTADGVAPADVAAADYKQVKMFVKQLATGKITSFVTSIVPQGLENTDNSGVLVVDVFDAVGQPVSGANVRIENLSAAPQIILDRTTGSDGRWIEVGLPAGVNAYHILASKTGYSSDQTYPITAGNPNPIKPDATIVVGQITQVSLSIDWLANLTINMVNELCEAEAGVDINVRGAKIIGTNAPPSGADVLKFDQDFTSDANGIVAMNNIEWDTYTPVLQAGEPYTILGTSPIQQITVLPATSQTFTFVLGDAVTNSLRVIVKDAATQAAIEGASVYIIKGGESSQSRTLLSGGSVWGQYDWTGGDGQVSWSDPEMYFADDGNIDINSAPTGVRLKKVSGRYLSPGVLESSTFNTGTQSNEFSIITWSPTSQHPDTTLKFQIASSNDPLETDWQYKGPDGTDTTYYTTSGSSIASVHNSDQYMRYKAFLSTADDKYTPVLTSVTINYVSGCATPGQVTFDYVGDPPDQPLSQGNNWRLEVSKAGYQTQIVDPLDISGNIVYEILLSP